MANPWLAIPLDDYESHMSSPGVAQLEALADLFDEALRTCRPESVVILGIAGGNGLSRIDAAVTTRIVGVDIHPEYLRVTLDRYPFLPLTLLCADLSSEEIDEPPAAMVHAALIFEHAGVDRCLRNAISLVAPGGFLSVVLQLPSAGESGVAFTPVRSIQSLRESFQLIDPEAFSAELSSHGFRPAHESRRAVAAGKAFWLGIFAR